VGITATSSEEIVVGAGDVYIDGVLQGATEEDNVFRITREYFSWMPNGVRGPVKGADYVVEEIAEMEFTLPEISAFFMAIMVPGSEMTNTASVTTGGGGSTTLNGAVAAGATSVTLTSGTNFATGDYIKIAGTGINEVRGPITLAGLVASFTVPLTYAHPTAAVVTEVDATGIVDRITSGQNRRLPSTAYHDFEIRIPGLDGRQVRFGITDAIASESPEFTATDDENMKPRITVQGRYDGATPAVAPWYIDKYSKTA
jgi:hypothetical protein